MQRRNIRRSNKTNELTQAYEKANNVYENNADESKVYDLLQKISSQLDTLMQSQELSPKGESTDLKQLNDIFGQILNKQSTARVGNTSNMGGNGGGSADNTSNTSNMSNMSNRTSRSSNAVMNTQTNNSQSKQQKAVVQTAAQMLADAQYELSNELEASLKKLKTVIEESEKVANRINNILSETKGQ